MSANFDKGVFYTVSLNIDTRTIVLTKCDKDTVGNRVVSGRSNVTTIMCLLS
ncbi:hypothetical protein [Psychromonas sp. KJ10-2]|uniref:hypothetical protein n=1 Tax=Psychromonas sp. KJ10-2 TaxID=3391822 RepID=UPI0039B41DFD